MRTGTDTSVELPLYDCTDVLGPHEHEADCMLWIDILNPEQAR